MKKLILSAFGMAAMMATTNAQIFSEDFTNGIPATFTLTDVDGATPHSSVNALTDAWNALDLAGDGNNVALSTSYFTSPGTADDWMSTPAIAIPTTPNTIELSWNSWAVSGTYPDGLEVYISTTGPTVADFTSAAVYTTTATGGEPATKTNNTIDVTAFAGGDIYVAFRNNSNDMYILAVDDIIVRELLQDDAEMLSLNLPAIGTSGSAMSVTGVIKNVGGNAITSLDITWNDGTTSQTDNITGLNIAPSASYNFTHASQWTPAGANGTTENLLVSVSNPNGNTDPDLSNNSLNTDVFLNLGLTATKYVLLEEFTTAPCTFCPDGAVVVEDVLAANPNVIAVGHHSGYSTDAMTIAENSIYSAAGFSDGAPTASIDRVEQGISRSDWASACTAELAKSTPVGVTVTAIYDNDTRMFDATLTATFVDYALPGDLRLNLFVVEDHVTGTGSGYDQINYYDTQSGHTYFGAGNPITGYDHRHVLRSVPTTAWGTAGIISNSPQANDVFTNTYNSIPVDASWNDSEIHLIAFVSYYDADTKKRIILNSYETKLPNPTNVNEILGENNLTVYPNPTSNVSTISFNLTEASSVNTEVYNSMGSLVFSQNSGNMNVGTQKVTFDGTDLPSGIYFVNVAIGDKVITKKVSLIK